MSELKTEFTKLERAKERGAHDRQTLYSILDATPICHVGYNVDNRPVVTPTCHWRQGDAVYWHGSRISRALLEAEAMEVCLTVTLLDGMVLARSAFHHSANYRSAMVFGKPSLVDDKSEKTETLRHFVDTLFPDRWDQLRPMSRKELDATTVLRLPIVEASSKIRTGPPIDLDEDLSHDVWAGVIPISLETNEAEAAPDMIKAMSVPQHAIDYDLG